MDIETVIADRVSERVQQQLSPLIAEIKRLLTEASASKKEEQRLYRIKDVLARFGWQRSYFWAIRNDKVDGLPPFPRPIVVGKREVWTAEDLASYEDSLGRSRAQK